MDGAARLVVNVFVAGATGAIGVPTVKALIAAGHEVTGTTRAESKRAAIESLGARTVVMDALVPDSVMRAVERASPDVIVELLTRLPDVPMRASDLEATNLLRTQGTANLIATKGRAHLVAESIAFFYGSSPQIFTENDEIPENMSPPMVQPAATALRAHEDIVRAAGGVVLRFGLFYGPDTRSSRIMARRMRRRIGPVIAGGRGVLPWVHVEDAATAVVAALRRAKPGEVYNVVDDEALTTRQTLDAFAEAVGAPRPWSVPKMMARLTAPYLAELMTWEVRVSNEKAKRELDWSPIYATVREGARTLSGI